MPSPMGVGVLLSIAALVLLIVYSSIYGGPAHVISFTIYGVTLLLMYICSTLVHSFPEGKAKNIFEILDHSAIYLFIAGTYTPIMVIVVEGAKGWVLLSLVWGLAVGGIIFKAFFVKRFIIISTLVYLLMGWMVVFVLEPIAAAIPVGGLVLLITGGVLYTVGTIFYIWRKFYYHHAVWHLFVLLASAAHFFSILVYLL
ncbi:hemolysin III [Salipaludibacillus aurantiacus]|uniref:Hemolysin III n=1 Tax=Salipaludibacillus aurantiacus TaxID=1601833 RepID=A0A1H9T8T4_9BACI|nr:hemolysin III [Salipaludibacillus aurantiacus]